MVGWAVSPDVRAEDQSLLSANTELKSVRPNGVEPSVCEG
jgi:hypothetical protein